MNKYNNLLLRVANRYHILKGEQETQEEWKSRLIYSICGVMAYASLWDDVDNTDSIMNMKKRIQEIYTGYMSMFPEISKTMRYDTSSLEDEIVNIFLNAGMVYHRSNQIFPAMKNQQLYDTILLQRGISIDDITYVSGIGLWGKSEISSKSNAVEKMFGLERQELRKLWQSIASSARWERNMLEGKKTECLRLQPPFSHGYWKNGIESTNAISILRTVSNASQDYYLYRYERNDLEISPLPNWRVEKHNYRTLACACLASLDNLPPIDYSEDESLIHIKMNYLLPPRELAFLKLYSWPESSTMLPCNFRRKVTKEVFTVVREILSGKGYAFRNIQEV